MQEPSSRIGCPYILPIPNSLNVFRVSYCHCAGPIVVQALLQLEQHMGSSPETRHLPADLQHPRSSCRCRSLLPSAQQCRHRAAGHQHLQPLCRSGLAHRGLFDLCSCVFTQAQSTLLISKGQLIFLVQQTSKFFRSHLNHVLNFLKNYLFTFTHNMTHFQKREGKVETTIATCWTHQVIGYLLKLIYLCSCSCHASHLLTCFLNHQRLNYSWLMSKVN